MALQKRKVHPATPLACLCFCAENGKFLLLKEHQNLATNASYQSSSKRNAIPRTELNSSNCQQFILSLTAPVRSCQLGKGEEADTCTVSYKYSKFSSGNLPLWCLTLQRKIIFWKNYRTLGHASATKQSALSLSTLRKLHSMHTKWFYAKYLCISFL